MPSSNLNCVYVCRHFPEAGEAMSTGYNIRFVITMLKLMPCVMSKYLSKEIKIFKTVKHVSGTQQISQ